MEEDNKLAALEGLLFVVGDDGLSLNQIMEIMEVSKEDAYSLINELEKKYESEDSGLHIHILGDAFKLTTKKEHRDYYQKLIENPSTNGLSQAALETLAIIAYNEPVTVREVDTIRGIDSREMVRRLVAKGFVKEAGKSDGIGRATLYATTKDFLDYFGLSSKEELPKFEEIKEDIDDTDLYDSKYKETE